jgi:hypothetical protein
MPSMLQPLLLLCLELVLAFVLELLKRKPPLLLLRIGLSSTRIHTCARITVGPVAAAVVVDVIVTAVAV